MTKYKVIAELTPFWDIWGKEHWRCIKRTNWFIIAWLAAVDHVSLHRSGTAHTLKRIK